jgi:hypothetical protein
LDEHVEVIRSLVQRRDPEGLGRIRVLVGRCGWCLGGKGGESCDGHGKAHHD